MTGSDSSIDDLLGFRRKPADDPFHALYQCVAAECLKGDLLQPILPCKRYMYMGYALCGGDMMGRKVEERDLSFVCTCLWLWRHACMCTLTRWRDRMTDCECRM